MNFTQYLTENANLVTFARHEFVFRQGDQCEDLYFVKQGLLKAQYLTLEGKEFVKSFITADHLIGNLSASYEGEPATFGVVCLEDSQLLKLNFASLFHAANEDLSLAKNMITFLLQLAMKKEKREFEFLCLSPEKRYKKICEERPELINRVTGRDIASYLGITPVALSRIRGRVK